MFSTLIEINKDKLTSVDLKIAEYIMLNTNEVLDLTSHDLAEKLDVGQSSIVRFTKKIGYQGYRHMLYGLKDITEDNKKEELHADDSTEVTLQKIEEQYNDVVTISKETNDAELIDKAVDLIYTSNKTIVHGVGNSQLFAEYFSNHLLKMGCDSVSSTNNHTIISLIARGVINTPVDLLILFSESGETEEIIKIAKLANKHKIPIIALTRMGNNTLSSLSDVVLTTFNDLSGSKLMAMTNRTSQLYLIDVLSVNLIKRDYDFFMNNILESEKLIR